MRRPGRLSRLSRLLRDERGSSPAEFVMVGVLLTALTLGVLQFGFAVYVRNVVHDAAVEGAYYGALADRTPEEGAERTRTIIARTVGAEFAQSVTGQAIDELGYPTVRVDVAATIPIAGLWGVPAALRVSGEAPKESFDAR
ncbi:MAG TPA: pilus assembly protein [Microbacteriaceae bacterium]|nr:pilus assembly protein [Microbacteriaceae bacterium]HQZ47647.1 pilus assembly protein [Microbacteriaceae bacterium]HRA09369.1 pilus assembly protein [Microbacteriaceae bacterium]